MKTKINPSAEATEHLENIKQWVATLPPGVAALSVNKQVNCYAVTLEPLTQPEATSIQVRIDYRSGFEIEAGSYWEWISVDSAETPQEICEAIVAGNFTEEFFLLGKIEMGSRGCLQIKGGPMPICAQGAYAPGCLFMPVHGYFGPDKAASSTTRHTTHKETFSLGRCA